MFLYNFQSGEDCTEVHYLRSAILTSAEELLAVVKRKNWQEVDLGELNILRSKLHFIIDRHHRLLKDTFTQAELKSYRLALSIQIELRQNLI